MSTVYVTHPRYVEHHLAEHPEHAGRIRAVWQRMDESGLLPRLRVMEAVPVTDDQIAAVHTEEYIALLSHISTLERMVRLDADTYAAPVSVEIAKLSAGALTTAVDVIFSGQAVNGVAACRPPGHHAIAERGMGFCLLSNVAIAARHAQQRYGIERVMVVDYDVHHGNGTEAIFYDDPSVLFISTHQHPLYPGTGAVHDTGTGRGLGYTLNIPLPAGVGDTGYAEVFEQVIWRAARRYQPELILVSAGFDGHWKDPLAGMKLTLAGYAHLTSELKQMADELCGGRILFAMEGGYNLDAISHGMTNIARILIGEAPIDPMGAPALPRGETSAAAVIAEVRAVHRL
jgi:acetoin utilization deacetylase AcuC-like enzyme